jgi:glycosyltransferase involved in cell wall biosynthesis
VTLPSFSIITPSFRQFDWLRLAIASVLDQEGVITEHIIQDAGTEGINKLFRAKVSANDDRHKVKLFVEKDAGMYDAINRGLAKARGDICSYLNCDEQFLPGTLRRVATFFDRHPDVDVLYGDAILIDNRGNPISYRRTVLPTLSHIRLAHLNTQSCSMFFRRTLLERGFLFDSNYQAIADGVWVEQLLLSGVRMATIREPLAVFTFTGQNLGASNASLAEAAKRRGRLPISKQLVKFASIIWLRLRKFFAGAYRRRKIDIEVYAFESANLRQRRTGLVGFLWPERS